MAVITCILMDSPIIRFKAVIPIAKFRFFSKKFTATVRGIRFCKFGPAIARTTIYAVKNCHNDWLLEKYIAPNPTTSEAKNIIHLGPNLSTSLPINGIVIPDVHVPRVAAKAMVFLSHPISPAIKSCTPPKTVWATDVAIKAPIDAVPKTIQP